MNAIFLKFLSFFLGAFLAFNLSLQAEEELLLRENLKKAHVGDYIVTASNKNYTLLHIYGKTPESFIIEEITVPEVKLANRKVDWKNWVKDNAVNNTSWVIYEININTGEMLDYYSFTKNGWYNIPQSDNFLSTLLNLKLSKVAPEDRRRIGRPLSRKSIENRLPWQPPMYVNGTLIQNVKFEAWKTSWPKDGGDLSGKTIEVYVPEENSMYPSYFPYWLQISGFIGQAKIRIIDSGSNLVSPKERPVSAFH